MIFRSLILRNLLGSDHAVWSGATVRSGSILDTCPDQFQDDSPGCPIVTAYHKDGISPETGSIRHRFGEEVDGERGQPVLTSIVATGHLRQPGFGMASARTFKYQSRRIAHRQAGREALHGPGPVEIQAVKVDQLRVGPVQHIGRGE